MHDPEFDRLEMSKSVESGDTPDRERLPAVHWIVVFVVNLIVPCFFSCSVTNQAGRFGMIFGILLLFALGWRLLVVSWKAGSAIVLGGWIIAAAQIVPLLHLFVGLIALRAVLALGQATRSGGPLTYVTSELGGFLATLMTGGLLMAVAFGLGLAIQWSFLRSTPGGSRSSKSHHPNRGVSTSP